MVCGGAVPRAEVSPNSIPAALVPFGHSSILNSMAGLRCGVAEMGTARCQVWWWMWSWCREPILTQNQPHWGRHQNSPSSPITHQVQLGPGAKSVPQMGLSLPEAGIAQAAFPSTFLMCAAGTLSLSTLRRSFDWAGNQKSPLLSFHKKIQTPSEGQLCWLSALLAPSKLTSVGAGVEWGTTQQEQTVCQWH